MQQVVGIFVASGGVDLVAFDWDNPSKNFTLIKAQPFELQPGNRAEAYRVLSDHLHTELHATERAAIFINASTPSQFRSKFLLQAAELRGVVMAISSTIAPVTCIRKTDISKHFGIRKTEEYIKDDNFWTQHVTGNLPKGFRMPAIIAIAGCLKK